MRRGGYVRILACCREKGGLAGVALDVHGLLVLLIPVVSRWKAGMGVFAQRTALSCDLAAPPAALRLRSRFCAALAPYALILVSLVPVVRTAERAVLRRTFPPPILSGVWWFGFLRGFDG